jgi:hypothetical protein
MILITENMPGNVHQTADYLNDLDLADFVLSIHPAGAGSIVVLKVPARAVKAVRERLGIDRSMTEEGKRRFDVWPGCKRDCKP